MDIVIYLMMCFIRPGDVNEGCGVYELRPQWEMTQEIMDRKVELICDNAEIIAIEHGSRLTRCEVLEDETSEEAIRS